MQNKFAPVRGREREREGERERGSTERQRESVIHVECGVCVSLGKAPQMGEATLSSFTEEEMNTDG